MISIEVFNKVEDLGPIENVRVVHRRLRIPKEDYYKHLANYDESNFDDASQLFVQEYIENKNDQGIVGMVRSWEEDDWILLDATFRYPL